MSGDVTYRPDSLCDEYERLGYWQRQSLGECLSAWAAQHGEAIALIEGNRRCSYVELDARVECLAKGFLSLGISSGARVLVQLPNGIAFVETCFALFRIGALPILAMPAQREKDIEALCDLATPVAFIVPERFHGFDYTAMASQVAAPRAFLRHLIIDGLPLETPTVTGLSLTDVRRLGEVKQASVITAPPAREAALLLLSGGTTGTPKLIPRLHADYVYNAKASAQVCGLDASSVYLAALPAAHNFPLACPGIIGTLSVGGRVVLAQTPGPDECFALIAREGVTFTSLVPPIVQLWVETREWDDTDLSSLRFMQVGGARCDAVLAEKVTPAFGCALQQVFGMAEGLLCYTRLDDPLAEVLHTQGRPLSPQDEVRLVDELGREVAPGEIGELLTRGPYTIQGYYRASEQNARAFTPDGFYRSGDLARWTTSGYLQVEGRIKQQINRAGEKIATKEVEEALCFHPAVEAAALVGVTDDRLGERSCAFLISSDPSLSVGDIRTFLIGRGLPAYKCPDQIEFIRHWPLTPIGKIDKQKLVARLSPAEGAMPAFREHRQTIASVPIELATALVTSVEQSDYVVYERNGEWLVALGRLATLRVEPTRVTLEQLGETRSWDGTDLIPHIASALGALGLTGWRAYGLATFELANHFHRISNSSEGRLMEMVIPRLEARLRDGDALLRAVDEKALADFVQQIAELDHRVAQRTGKDVPPILDLSTTIAEHDAAHYRQQVAQAVEDIRANRYEKVILSRRVPVPAPVDLVQTYRHGRRHNTPARSFLLSRPGLQMLGFSPETIVEVSAKGEVSTQPLAGTRALGRSPDEQRHLRRELETDVKEIAEHAVSVRLAVEELQPICAKDSVRVTEFMGISERGSVQHLASRVCGQLADGASAWQAFKALFPAVTASGIPKRESLVAIQRYEGGSRGPYSGSVMMVDADGSMDAALVLRSLFRQGNDTWLQAGAGIVAQSTPERELEETREKLSSVSGYLVLQKEIERTEAPSRRGTVGGNVQ